MKPVAKLYTGLILLFLFAPIIILLAAMAYMQRSANRKAMA